MFYFRATTNKLDTKLEANFADKCAQSISKSIKTSIEFINIQRNSNKMIKIFSVSFVLLSCCILLDAISFGGRLRTNWTRVESERGYKLIGDMAYKVPSLKELTVCSLKLYCHYFRLHFWKNIKFCVQNRPKHGAWQTNGLVVEYLLRSLLH